MAQPEAYLGDADKLFDAHGKLANDRTRKFLESFMHSYASWIDAKRRQCLISPGDEPSERLAMAPTIARIKTRDS